MPTPVAPKATAGAKTGSKKDRTLAIYRNSTSLTRKYVIEMFVVELDMSLARASTYYAMCKKELG